MGKPTSYLVLLVAIMALLVGCERGPKQSQQSTTAPTEKPNMSVIIANAVELREEKIFLVTLEFKKEQFTLNLWKHAKNAMAAEQRTIIVGERTFNSYQLGQKVSSVSDGWGVVFNGEIAEYVVRPIEKKIESQYFWANRSGTQREINKEQYNEALEQLRSSGRQLLTTPFAGIVRTYVLEKPLTEYQFVERKPLNRYFVTIKVENSTLTLSLSKYIRNKANTHEITLEVPRDVYDKTGDVWDKQLSTGSLIVKGHLSELHGKVVRRWSEVDSNFQLAKTDDGQQFIIPK